MNTGPASSEPPNVELARQPTNATAAVNKAIVEENTIVAREEAPPPFNDVVESTGEGEPSLDQVVANVEEYYEALDAGEPKQHEPSEDETPKIKAIKVLSVGEFSRDSTVEARNTRACTNDEQSSKTPSNNTNTDTELFMSESEEFSNISGRNHRLLELSTVSSASNQTSVDTSTVNNFLVEHRIFLNAALNLFTEKDHRATELGMMDPIVLKAGALKKASHLMNGVWRVKYVEVRRGMFSYYENAVSSSADDPKGKLLLRKNIPLEASICTCRAVKLHEKALNFAPGGAIFELTSSNNTNLRRLWMANSREERQAWIHAINNAMVGGSVTRGDSMVDHRGLVRTVSGRSPFKADLRLYLRSQSAFRSAKVSQEYLLVLRELLNKSLHVPVKWIAKQGLLSSDGSAGNNSISGGAFHEETVEVSLDQLWKDLLRDSVCINDETFRGDEINGPERIMGALTRRLLSVGSSETSGSRSDLRESEALVYARDLLLAGNRTRSGGDSYYAVNTLFGNQDLVVVVPGGSEVEPVQIEISEDKSDESFHLRFNDKSGWIKTRSKLQRRWRKQFFVFSEGTLSYYEGATPRPHGLRGQRALTGTKLSITRTKSDDTETVGQEVFVLTIVKLDGSKQDRLLLFESEHRLLDWVFALECITKDKSNPDQNRKPGPLRRRSISGDQKTSMQDILDNAREATLGHARQLGLDVDGVQRHLAKNSQRATSALRVSVRAATSYKVCTTDPEGDAAKDTWATVRAQFMQAFRITGGPNGRIMRGEEIVRLSIVDSLAPLLPSPESTAQSPTTMRARINRHLFRNQSIGDEIGDENTSE